MPTFIVIGAGLAGSEAALQLAKRGHRVRLYDLKPHTMPPAHRSPHYAEIVCSNSLGSQGPRTASGLLKLELEHLGCELLKIAHQVAVPAGQALAVDRDRFAEAVTAKIQAEPLIECLSGDVTDLPPDADYTLIATGPLTTPGLAQTLARLVNRGQLFFFDAASPIVTRDSINFDIAFVQDRYGKSGPPDPDTHDANAESYINCPLDKPQYEALLEKILSSEKTPLKDFEQEAQNESQKEAKTAYFESCLPIEVIASRGPETLRYGPMKPVGLVDPRTGRFPYAAVQLRQDNREGTLYNMVGFQTNLKWGPQKEMIQLIPGLENADVVRYGVMHRNTYLHSPEVLRPTLQLKDHPPIFIAGQLTGTEGYTESIASGLVAAMNMDRLAQGLAPQTLPVDTMLGALLHYITREEAVGKDFQPINSNWGLLPPLVTADGKKIRNKADRNALYVERSLAALAQAAPVGADGVRPARSQPTTEKLGIL